jgi:F-type H+-transporting ATPase subunit epsilon
MTLKILSPENIIYNETDVIYIILPTAAGQITILPNHVNFITKLYNGTILIKTLTKEKRVNTSSGFVEIYNNNICILTDYYTNPKNKFILIQRKQLSNILLLKLQSETY